MRPTLRCLFQASRSALSHENPLGLPPQGPGLPKSGTIPRMQRGLPQKRAIKDVKKVIAVSSAKGGVGKSTVAANLSLAFARLGYRAGILDVDVFGPSIPTLFNLNEEPRLSSDNLLLPLTSYGVSTMSMGYLVPPSSPIIWRGPILLKALQQLLHSVAWPSLDILVLDLPPGTGDTQLSVAQQIVLDGAVIVTTPHTLALADVVRGMGMWEKVNVKVLGVVENMSVFKCPGCGGEHRVFGRGDKVRDLCREKGTEVLGEVPLDQGIADDAQDGKPTVAADPEGEGARVFMDLAKKLGERVGLGR